MNKQRRAISIVSITLALIIMTMYGYSHPFTRGGYTITKDLTEELEIEEIKKEDPFIENNEEREL